VAELLTSVISAKGAAEQRAVDASLHSPQHPCRTRAHSFAAAAEEITGTAKLAFGGPVLGARWTQRVRRQDRIDRPLTVCPSVFISSAMGHGCFSEPANLPCPRWKRLQRHQQQHFSSFLFGFVVFFFFFFARYKKN